MGPPVISGLFICPHEPHHCHPNYKGFRALALGLVAWTHYLLAVCPWAWFSIFLYLIFFCKMNMRTAHTY